jgi:hypothetical protein
LEQARADFPLQNTFEDYKKLSNPRWVTTPPTAPAAIAVAKSTLSTALAWEDSTTKMP